jgi:hypothetical protein
MTDVERTQAQIRAATSTTDDELINFLVPPPRPRWQIAVVVLSIAVVLVGIVLLSESGAVASRLDAQLARWGADKRAFSVVFRIHNQGWTSAEVRAVDASQAMFRGMHVVTRLPYTLEPDNSFNVEVRFDSFDCDQDGTDDRTREIRVRVKNTFGVTLTRTIKIDGSDVEQEGWPLVTTAHACGRVNS